MKKRDSLLLKQLATFLLVIGLALPAFAQTPAQPVSTIDAAIRTEAVEGAIKALNDAYVFPEVAQKMEAAIRERMQRKEYDNITDAMQFAAKLTSDLQAVSKDKHLRVVLSQASRLGLNQQQQREAAVKRNFGFEKAERLNGNIGYLDLRGLDRKSVV